ncbi:MAG: hypothetical protein MUD10_04575 [Candidatus Pacebacteria bacterium]|jgi:hypothetical protein|nr:hypothetical protein [Candidatus Paceibacterota bacterium]
MRKFIATYLIIALQFLVMAPLCAVADDGATTTEEIGVELAAAETSASTTKPFMEPLVPVTIEGAATTTQESAATSTEPAANVGDGPATSTLEAVTTTEPIELLADGEANASTTIADAAATSTDETATSTAEAATTTEDAANEDGASASTTFEFGAVSEFSVAAVWQMAPDGTDDSVAEFAQFKPSGEYQVSKQIKMCGVAGGRPLVDIEGVYGQIYYPKTASFGTGDAQNRTGCGQLAGKVCKMQKLDKEAGFDLLCEKIQKNNTTLPQYAPGKNYIDFCASDGKLLAETAAVYCCDQELAYDDVAGSYEASVIVKDTAGVLSDLTTSSFSYLPLAKLDLDFDTVNYGKVKENTETVADETISQAMVRNVGNVPAKLSLWQDDMGLGKTGDAYNVRYGARINATDASWVNYTPFETVVMPAVFGLGQSMDIDLSVKVLAFPPLDGQNAINFSGKMEIDAVAAPVDGCVGGAPNENSTDADNKEGVMDVKPETEITDGATTTQSVVE